MAININVNGESINYPQTGDTNWSDEATDFAVQTASAFGKIGLSSGTTVDIPGTLDVTGNTTLDANLSVGGNATITGNLTANGNSNLGNASGDTIAVTGILNVDSGVLYVNPTNNRVGINDTTPSQALDVTGNVAITGNETVGGTLNVTGATTLSSALGVTGNLSVNGNTTLGDASGDSLTINSNGVSIPNGLNFDSNTFVIDAANNRVGINIINPDVALRVIGRIKLADSLTSGTSYLEMGTSSTQSNNYHIGSEGSGTFTIYNGNVGTGTSLFRFNSNGQLSAVVPGGSTLYPGYLCRAWVNFNGTGSVGANQTIRGSENVSSILKNATGDYTVNIDIDMPDGNYAIFNTGSNNADGQGAFILHNRARTTSGASYSILCYASNFSTATDQNTIFSSVFR